MNLKKVNMLQGLPCSNFYVQLHETKTNSLFAAECMLQLELQ